MGDRGVIIHVVNGSDQRVQVIGLDGSNVLALDACDVLRWVIPEGQAIVDVLTPSRRVTVPIDVDADSDDDIRVYIDASGLIGPPTRIDPGAIESACARGKGHGAARSVGITAGTASVRMASGAHVKATTPYGDPTAHARPRDRHRGL